MGAAVNMSVPGWCCRTTPALTRTLFSVEKRAVAELINTPLHPQAQDLTGRRFGILTVLRYAGRDRGRALYWVCRCECGRERPIRGRHLLTASIASCGCVSRAIAAAKATIHGRSKTPEYGVWRAMKQRCFNPKDRMFSSYGGRGITVCERWKGPDGFVNFLDDMGERPSAAHSLDRIDNDGPYSPENCRWATDSEQQSNRRNCRKLTHDGVTLTIAEWSRRTGIPDAVLRQRIRKLKWPTARALSVA